MKYLNVKKIKVGKHIVASVIKLICSLVIVLIVVLYLKNYLMKIGKKSVKIVITNNN
jgi:hypothetical protein